MIADALSRMLKKSAAERITIEELAQHPWIRSCVWAIYFDKSFQAVAPTAEDDQEAAVLIRKWGLDPSKLYESGTEESIVKKFLNRRKQNQMVAHLELFVHGKRRLKVSLPELGIASPWTEQEVSARPAKVSLLDNIQQQTGFTVTTAGPGKGRRLTRPLGRVSPLCTASMSFPRRARDVGGPG
jgi:hypothetical protein